LERWPDWSPEVSDRQLLEQSQKAPVKSKTVFITETTHVRLKELCKREGLKMNHAIDRIIREWMEKKEAK